MTTVAMAPNGSSNDHSRTDMGDMEEEDKQDDIAKDSKSDDWVMDAVGNKIAKLQKKKRQITAQYTRVLKQWDDNVGKHAQVL
jgi:hypothetical protein